MHYVGIESAEIAKQRIAERVKMGGHGIPDRDVEKRYEESVQFRRGCRPIPLLTLDAQKRNRSAELGLRILILTLY